MLMKAHYPNTASPRVERVNPHHWRERVEAFLASLDAEQFSPCPLFRTTYTTRPMPSLRPDETTRKLVQREVEKIGGSRGRDGRFTGRKSG